mmetsp:Transcript_24247/g.46040  ORF Transcript_24247/g.46040 Transcript_24247/m.46040 type:complete len:437 (+) Transcript_24247:53-1363(+)
MFRTPAASVVLISSAVSAVLHSQGDYGHRLSGSKSFLEKRVHPAENRSYTTQLSEDEEQQNYKSYLSRVYPIVAGKFNHYSKKQATDLLKGLSLYYEPLPIIRGPFPLQGAEVFGVSCSTKIQNKFVDLTHKNGQELTFENVGDLVRHEIQIYDALDFSKPRKSWPIWAQESVLEEGAHIEVTHFACDSKCKLADPSGLTKAEHFLDSSPWSTAWYWARRGSGIFYAAGRSKTAVMKNHMLLLLLRELQEKRPDRVAAFRNLFSGKWESNLLPAGSTLEDALEATLSGTPCTEVGLDCFDGYRLRDYFDESMVWLARELGYDTLIFAASPVGVNTLATELVDVRLPDKDWLAGAQERRYPPKWNVVGKWAQYMRDEKILTIRNPFNPKSNVGVQPCDFDVMANQLYCKGTLSEESRFNALTPDSCDMAGDSQLQAP